MNDYTDLLAKIDKDNKAKAIKYNKISKRKRHKKLIQKLANEDKKKKRHQLELQECRHKPIDLDKSLGLSVYLLRDMYEQGLHNNDFFVPVNFKLQNNKPVPSNDYKNAKFLIALNLIKPISYKNNYLYLTFTNLGKNIVDDEAKQTHYKAHHLFESIIETVSKIGFTATGIIFLILIGINAPSSALIYPAFTSIIAGVSMIIYFHEFDEIDDGFSSITFSKVLKHAKDSMSLKNYKQEKSNVISLAKKNK